MRRLILIGLLALAGCGTSATDGVSQVQPTAPPATVAPAPTNTPAPTAAPAPTATPKPTNTPKPKPTATPKPALPEIIKSGYGQDGRQVSAVFLLKNPSAKDAMTSIRYQLAAYDEAGTVLKSSSGIVSVLFAGEVTAIQEDMFVGEGQTVAKIDVQLGSNLGYEESPFTGPAFFAEGVTFLPDPYFAKVTGTVVSKLTKDFEKIKVVAVGYNEAGDIIGGGFTYLDFVPANGKAAAEISVTFSEVPAKVELFANLSALSL